MRNYFFLYLFIYSKKKEFIEQLKLQKKLKAKNTFL